MTSVGIEKVLQNSYTGYFCGCLIDPVATYHRHPAATGTTEGLTLLTAVAIHRRPPVAMHRRATTTIYRRYPAATPLRTHRKAKMQLAD